MPETKKNKIVLIGAGLSGSFLATLLANRGYTIELFEKFSKKEIFDTNSKRSYNITFLGYGIDMFKKANLWETIRPHMHPLTGTSTQLSKNLKPINTRTLDKKNEYYGISRAKLLYSMLEQLAKNPSVTIHFNSTLLSIDRYQKEIFIQNTETKKIETISCDVVIGTDGANSLVRPFLQQGQNTNHIQEYSQGGYIQFIISNEQIKKLQLQEGIAYTWSAQKKFILAFPQRDGSLASLLIFPKDKSAFEKLQSEEAIKELVQNDFPLLLPIYKNLAEQIMINPVGGFVTIKTDPWYYKDFITIVGDAAHAFYPFFGQGTSAAFGDCMQLVNLIDQYGTDWGKILPLYQKARKRHMDSLGELSKEALMRYARNKRADYATIYDFLEAVGHKILPKYIHPPVLSPVMNDPEHTDDYVNNSKKQRALAKRFGFSLFVSLLTKTVALYEHLGNRKA